MLKDYVNIILKLRNLSFLSTLHIFRTGHLRFKIAIYVMSTK
jgi:hypothetical protein